MFNHNMVFENNEMLKMSKGPQVCPKLPKDRASAAWGGLGIVCGVGLGSYRMIKLYLDREENGRPPRAETGHPEKHAAVWVILALGTQHRDFCYTAVDGNALLAKPSNYPGTLEPERTVTAVHSPFLGKTTLSVLASDRVAWMVLLRTKRQCSCPSRWRRLERGT